MVPWVLCGHGGKERETIAEYIQNQLKEDGLGEQLRDQHAQPVHGPLRTGPTHLEDRTYAFTRP